MVVLEPLPWDTKHFGIRCARLRFDEDDTAKRISRALSGSGFAFVTCRAEAGDVRKSRMLQEAGFTIADVRLHLDLSLRGFRPPKLLSGMKLVAYAGKYHAALREISRRSFWSDHFHADPRFDAGRVDEMYAIWVDRCVRERYDIFVATEGGAAKGFLAGKGQDGEFYIELVAVAEEVRGRWVGHDLVVHALANFRNDFEKAAIGVQLANLPAIRLYEKVGFRLASSEYTFHWWRSRE